MAASPLKILLVEDAETVAELLKIWLTEGDTVSIEMDRVLLLSEGLERLAAKTYDAVLLDLNLPDSSGLDTVRSVVQHSPMVPVVVLTGAADPHQAIEAVKLGAQDYVVKTHMSADAIIQSLIHAVERQRRAPKADHERPRHWIEGEVERIQQLAGGSWPIEREDDEGTLRSRQPDVFDALAEDYSQLLTAIVEASQADVGFDASEGLSAICEQMAEAWAGPVDVLALHAAVLRSRLSTATVDELKSHPNATRSLGLQFMGHLAAAYRDLSRRRGADRRRRTRTRH